MASARPVKAMRIVARGMQGWTAQRIARLVGCSEVYAQQVLQNWRLGGGA